MRLRRFVTTLAACSLGALAGCPLATDFGAEPDDSANRRPGDNSNPGTRNDDYPGSDGGANPGTGDEPNSGSGNQDTPATPVPAELTGTWKTILTYVPGFYLGPYIPVGNFTGSLGVSYYFGTDGQYQYDLNSAEANGFCFRTTSWTEWGMLAAAGSQVTLKPARATNVITDTCGESVLDDNAPTTGSTLAFTPEQDATGWPMLRLRLPSGEDLLLERCRDCD